MHEIDSQVITVYIGAKYTMTPHTAVTTSYTHA